MITENICGSEFQHQIYTHSLNPVMSLREVGLDYLPDDIKRPGKDDKIQELVIPLDYVKAEWLPGAVQDTANI